MSFMLKMVIKVNRVTGSQILKAICCAFGMGVDWGSNKNFRVKGTLTCFAIVAFYFMPKSSILTKNKHIYNCLRLSNYPAGIYMFKVNNRNIRTRCEIWSKLAIKTPFTPCSSVSIINFEHVNTGWDSKERTAIFQNTSGSLYIVIFMT